MGATQSEPSECRVRGEPTAAADDGATHGGTHKRPAASTALTVLPSAPTRA